ncbi:zf-DNL-domain-containing protein [Acrodontium crateriforme]|uniref:Zf-DNL-domain-containing protein n=1 Tax=Acrodontium crateriforme TaxID=150365 RepID=A0AAQ3M3J1_9PEZI|nr:zf-DNL-domain-containing protein [Acrodontium crateriforme]
MNSATAIRILNRASRFASKPYCTHSRLSWLAAPRQFHHHARPAPPTLLRKHEPHKSIANQCRYQSSDSSRPLTDRRDLSQAEAEKQRQKEEIAARKAEEPAYEMTFTCRQCLERTSHRITKQAYHFGTTLVTCPGCKNRHLISDHLKIFSDKSITIEDIMKEKGQLLKKGRLGADGDIEFYNDEHKPS